MPSPCSQRLERARPPAAGGRRPNGEWGSGKRRERGERQIKALEARRRDGHDERDSAADQDAGQDGERQRHAQLEQEDDHRVCADAVEGEVREGHLPGDAEEEVVGKRERDP